MDDNKQLSPKQKEVLKTFDVNTIEEAAQFTIPITDTIKLVISLTKDKIKDQQDFVEGVVTSRGLQTAAAYTVADETVINLANRLATQNEDVPDWLRVKAKTANPRGEFLNRALLVVQRDAELQTQAARMEATMAIILREADLVILNSDGNELQRIPRGLFQQRITPRGATVIELHPIVWKALKEEHLRDTGRDEDPRPVDYFDSSAINRERRIQGLPDLPPKYSLFPPEQMIMYIVVLREHFILFQNALATMWQEYIGKIIEIAFALNEEEEENPVDDNGFQPESVDNNLDAAL